MDTDARPTRRSLAPSSPATPKPNRDAGRDKRKASESDDADAESAPEVQAEDTPEPAFREAELVEVPVSLGAPLFSSIAHIAEPSVKFRRGRPKGACVEAPILYIVVLQYPSSLSHS